MDFNIVALEEKNIKDVYELLKGLAFEMKELDKDKNYFQFNEYPENLIIDYINNTILDNDSIIYIAVKNLEIIGFIGGKIQNNFLPFLYPDKVAYIFGAYIKKEFRRKGVLKKLEEKIISFFKERNVEYIDLNVMSYNSSGSNCWKKLGYKTFRKQKRKKLNNIKTWEKKI